MYKISIIAKNKNTYFIERLTSLVRDELVVFDPWSDFEIPKADHYICRTSGVYGSDLDLMILKSLSSNFLINSYDCLRIFRSKESQYCWFEDNNFPILPWISLPKVDLITVEKFFRLFPEVVVKPLIGQGGWGIEGLTWDTFKSWKKRKGQDIHYLIQPFIRNTTEFRYFFIKGGTSVTLERVTKSGVAANFQKKGTAKLSSLPNGIESLLSRIINASGAHYGAIDLLVKDNQVYILELNTVPGIQQLEQISGDDIARAILNSLMI